MKPAQASIRELIGRFNSKPFTQECEGANCSSPATRCTVYQDNVDSPHWWCPDCDAYQYGAAPGKLHGISTYQDAINHIEFFSHSPKSDWKALIKHLGKAKGLPSRVGEPQLQKFFFKV